MVDTEPETIIGSVAIIITAVGMCMCYMFAMYNFVKAIIINE